MQATDTDTDTTGRVSTCVTRPNQPMIRQFFLIGVIVSFVFSMQQARASDELVPPFGFRWNDSMARVEAVLQYEYPEWSIERYNQRMGEIRKYFDEKYGTGKLVSRSRDRDTDVIQTLVGYQWMVGTTMLELYYFSAQHDNLVYRTISVDYKAL